MKNRLKPEIKLESEGAFLSGRYALGGTPISAQAMFALALCRGTTLPVVWVASGVGEMQRLHESIETLCEPTDRSAVLFRQQGKDPAIWGEHLKLSKQCAKKESALFVVTSPQALDARVPRPERAENSVCLLRVGERAAFAELTAWMSAAGYVFGVEVYSPGEAAVRGGILDVWVPGLARPVRIEFFGDEIDSIRFFDDQTQCSIEKVEAVELVQVFPCEGEDETVLLVDLLPSERIWVDVDGVAPLKQQLSTGFDFYSTGLFAVSLDAPPSVAERARRSFVQKRCMEASAGWQVHFFFETSGTFARFEELYSEEVGFEALLLHRGVLHESCEDVERKIRLITESDFYAYQTSRNAHARHAKRFKKQERVSEAADIQPGDFVVHVEHGVGKYLGIVETLFAGKPSEVLCIEYAKGEKVYLPVSQAHLLTRYKAMGKKQAKLHTLGGKKWIRDKQNAQEAVEDLAARLLQTQAQRQARRGFRFAKDSAMQAEFEAAFPYTETPDQLTASAELKADMERSRPMDRLLCGDVGFGKTEVAMRAAFKAVQDRKQVAVLVPTTVLAQQHFESFAQRMAAFPVRMDMVSRFRTRAQQKKTLLATQQGEVDILVGTHRLLSADVQFKDLGLVIIDEEQRFGVEAKERLKALRSQVDVITMSATPIPRTLYMGITGVRDLSVIQTAPQERQPVDTIVVAPDDEIIAEAIRLELYRGGQLFYLHNRVKTIHHVENKLSSLVPEARIAVAHGQMGETALSETMHAFVQGRYDVLLCTTIIESGVDIPNCNTIIIENAERFGLSDLYQLRGRVGRSTTKAFAYLMPSHGGAMLSSAADRIGAIQKHSGLGAGFRLAMRDLELRGAGNLLGAKQSGHIATVGFDLYCQLLRRSIALLKGKRPPPLMDVVVKLDFLDLSPASDVSGSGAYIPYSYIEDENLRLRLYQRMSALSTRQEIRLMKREIKDRFGKLPAELQRLLLLAELRIVAAEQAIQSVVVRDQTIFLAPKGGVASPCGLLSKTSASKQLRDLIKMVSSS